METSTQKSKKNDMKMPLLYGMKEEAHQVHHVTQAEKRPLTLREQFLEITKGWPVIPRTEKMRGQFKEKEIIFRAPSDEFSQSFFEQSSILKPREAKEGNQENHFLYWLIEKFLYMLKEKAKLDYNKKIHPTDFKTYARKVFSTLWNQWEGTRKHGLSKDVLSQLLQENFKDRTADIFGDVVGSEEIKAIQDEFADDAEKLYPLMQTKQWNVTSFMLELEQKVEKVPLTKSNLLNKTYRSYAKEVIEGLRKMAEEIKKKKASE